MSGGNNGNSRPVLPPPHKFVDAGLCLICSNIADLLCPQCYRCEACGHKPWCEGKMMETHQK